MDKANGLNVTGFCKNADDGSVWPSFHLRQCMLIGDQVIGEAQGSESSLDKFVQHLNMGPTHAKVSKVDQKDIEAKEGESKFEQ